MKEAALAALITSLTEAALAAHSYPVAVPTGIVWQTHYPDIQAKNRDKENRAYFKDLADEQSKKAETAVHEAEHADPLEERRRDRVLAIDKWDTGESGPKDVRNMPGGDTAIALYNNAKTTSDAGRKGHGVNTMTEGTNPNFGMAIDKQNDMERDLAAKGALEGHVTDVLEGNKAEMYGLSEMGNQRRMAIAGMRTGSSEAALGRYQQAWLQTRQPNFFRQLAMQFAQGAGSGVMSLATGGISGLGGASPNAGPGGAQG